MQRGLNCHRRAWLLSGTGEGPLLAKALIRRGWQVTVSVVSYQASLAYLDLPLKNLWVRKLEGVEGIKSLLYEVTSKKERFDWVLDLTHPFALEISANLKKACEELKQPLLRFERPMDAVPEANWISSWKDLSDFDLSGKRMLMAIGARYLSEAVLCARSAGAEVYARILPNPESIRKALASGIPESNLAITSPFNTKPIGFLERELCHRWKITGVLCRQSGGLTQRLWQKICKRQEIDLWLLSRVSLPKEIEVVNSFKLLLERISLPSNA